MINEDGQIIEIIAENKPITIEISKQDIYGNELVGAEMQLTDNDGNIVDEWVSDGTNHIVSKLSVGEYILKEIAAPDGYVIATDIKFEVLVDGSVIVENIEATAISESGHPLIVMVDDTTKVEISKQDITTSKELEGATLQIIDKDGNVIEEWISGKEPHYIEAFLKAGETYTLHEVIAPNGYEIANDIQFTVLEDGSVQRIVMYDELTPKDTPKYTDSVPKTGDTFPMTECIISLVLSLAVLIGLVLTKKKRG